MKLLLTLGLISTSLTFTACNNPSKKKEPKINFDSGNGTTDSTTSANNNNQQPPNNNVAPPPAPAAPPVAPPPVATPAVGCNNTSPNITVAKAVADTVSTSQANQTLRFEVSIQACADGTLGNLNGQAIYFDMDAGLNTGVQALQYALADGNGAALPGGILQIFRGNDMFGNVGKFAYWMTQPVATTAIANKVILEVKFGNAIVKTRGLTDTTIKAFVRVGTSSQPAQLIVKATP